MGKDFYEKKRQIYRAVFKKEIIMDVESVSLASNSF